MGRDPDKPDVAVTEEELHAMRIGAPHWDSDYTRLVDSYRAILAENAELRKVADAVAHVVRDLTNAFAAAGFGEDRRGVDKEPGR